MVAEPCAGGLGRGELIGVDPDWPTRREVHQRAGVVEMEMGQEDTADRVTIEPGLGEPFVERVRGLERGASPSRAIDLGRVTGGSRRQPTIDEPATGVAVEERPGDGDGDAWPALAEPKRCPFGEDRAGAEEPKRSDGRRALLRRSGRSALRTSGAGGELRPRFVEHAPGTPRARPRSPRGIAGSTRQDHSDER
jgi:hypothetical protein